MATDPGGDPRTYNMAFPTVGWAMNFPVEGFLGRAVTRTAMWVHFLHRHVQDIVIILEGGKPSSPTVPPVQHAGTLTRYEQEAYQHRSVQQGGHRESDSRWRMAEEEMRESAERSFKAYGIPLKTVTSFKYLGQVLTSVDNDWLAVTGSVQKTWKNWAQLERILGQ